MGSRLHHNTGKFSFNALVMFLFTLVAGYGASLWDAQDLWKTIGVVKQDTFQSEFHRLFVEVYRNARNSVSNGSNPSLTSSRTIFNVTQWKDISNGGLTESDRALLGEVYYNASSVFEFGLGESTQIAAHVGVPRYSGVDSDARWVTQARAKAAKNHFRFYFADIGQTHDWYQ
jgi:hypothetical protein